MSFKMLGGNKQSPAIPCGIDFLNHRVTYQSTVYFDGHDIDHSLLNPKINFETNNHKNHHFNQTNHNDNVIALVN